MFHNPGFMIEKWIFCINDILYNYDKLEVALPSYDNYAR